MEATPAPASPKKRRLRRPKYECSKCETKLKVEAVPTGWLIVWDDKLGRFVHYCLGCQGGRRARKKS
jgi:hypothetical protein